LNFKIHFKFLKVVFVYTLTAFGGPQGLLGSLLKYFVHRNNFLSEAELIEYNSFCQLLPGASSTQLLGVIAYKRGGIGLSILSLLIWIFPACFLMGLFSFLIRLSPSNIYGFSFFKYLQPMVIGFLVYATYKSFKISINNKITTIIFIVSSIITFFFLKSPWVFPILIICSAFVTNISNKRIMITKKESSRLKIKWFYGGLFIILFIVAGILSETSRKQQWENKKSYNLFENFYRFGSIVFGGGDVLLPMMLDQYVTRSALKTPNNDDRIIIKKETLMTGYGIVRTIPGPVFSIGSFVGGIALQNGGVSKQIQGILIGSTAIFIPSILILFFLFPVWEMFKNYVVVYRALEGIKSVIVGVMLATIIYLLKDFYLDFNFFYSTISLFIIIITFLSLNYTKLPTPILFLFTLLLGFIF
jgi:chromate transporter